MFFPNKRKTYKREFAVYLVWFPYMALVGAAIIWPSPDRTELVSVLWVPAVLVAASAFGLDALAKQIRPGPQEPPPEPYPVEMEDGGSWPGVDTNTTR